MQSTEGTEARNSPTRCRRGTPLKNKKEDKKGNTNKTDDKKNDVHVIEDIGEDIVVDDFDDLLNNGKEVDKNNRRWIGWGGSRLFFVQKRGGGLFIRATAEL